MAETIQVTVDDDTAAWLRRRAQVHHGGDVAPFIAAWMAREQKWESRNLTPDEQPGEEARRIEEWEASLPADELEKMAEFEEFVAASSLHMAEKYRRLAAAVRGER